MTMPFFKLGSEWRWVISITLRLLYCQGKSARYPKDRRVVWDTGVTDRAKIHISAEIRISYFQTAP
jgi:hypothetical protein